MNNSLRIALSLLLISSLSACSYLPTWLGGTPKEVSRFPGERNAVLPVAVELKADESAKAEPVNLPPATPNMEWAQHTGMFNAMTGNIAGGALTSESDVKVGEGNEYEHGLVARPVIAGGLVYAMDAEGYVSAHDATNIGSVKWVAKGVYEDVDQDNIGGGLAYESGKLYATSGRGLVVAMDAQTGAELWRKSLGIPVRSAPRVGEGKVFVVTIDNQIYALDAASGNTAWSQRGLAEIGGWMNAVSPTLARGAVLVPYSSGDIYAFFAADGRELWNESVSMQKRTQASDIFTGIGGDPLVDDEAIFAVSSDNGLAAMHLKDGQRFWEKPIASSNSPWLAGNYLFVVTADNTVVCFLKHDGRIRWATKLASFEDEKRKLKPITWRGPVLVDGRLAVVSSHGQLLLLSGTDGAITQTLEVEEGISTAPVVAGGTLYLVGKNAKLYAFK